MLFAEDALPLLQHFTLHLRRLVQLAQISKRIYGVAYGGDLLGNLLLETGGLLLLETVPLYFS
jgi:hypothetical protein